MRLNVTSVTYSNFLQKEDADYESKPGNNNQGFILSGLRNFQGWRLYHLSGTVCFNTWVTSQKSASQVGTSFFSFSLLFHVFTMHHWPSLLDNLCTGSSLSFPSHNVLLLLDYPKLRGPKQEPVVYVNFCKCKLKRKMTFPNLLAMNF